MPAPYGVDFDRSASVLGPWGEDDNSMIHYGKCWTDSDHFSDAEVQKLGDCSRYVYDRIVKAQFIWTFRNELEPKWNFVQAYDKGWLNKYRNQASFLQ